MKNISETERARRYLLHKIIHSGRESMRLPTERELMETLQLSRVTIRRAINDLLQGHFIQKLPGRQGIYTNPVMVDVTMHSLVVLKKTNYIDSRNMSTLGAMCNELLRSSCFCSLNHFQTGGYTPQQIADELKIGDFDCIIILSPTLQLCEELSRRDIPFLALEPPGYANAQHSNLISFDHEDFGRKIAGTMLKRKLKKVLFFSDLPDIYHGFCEVGKDQFDIAYCDSILDKNGLKKLISAGQYDGIAAMTREVGIQTLYDVLRELPEIKKPELFLFPWPESQLFKKSNPGYYTEIFDPSSFLDQLQELGKAAAHGVMQVLNDLPVNINKVKLQR